METPEQIRDRLLARFPGAPVTLVPNGAPGGQASLLLEPSQAREMAEFLRDDPSLQLDFCSNMTGVDWPQAGCLEAVYHLYSMARKHGPLVIRQRTANRADGAAVASRTPVWRSAEVQEREAFDLFGIGFTGHPDLRRILMWDGFEDHPMRKDYAEPDDYEWEPTPHDAVLAKARLHYASAPVAPPAKEASP